jgi:hypothetical protein
VLHCAGPKQRIQVGAVVRMPVADQDRVDIASIDSLKQPGQRGVPGVNEEVIAAVLHEVATARLTGHRPCPAAPQYGELHRGILNLGDTLHGLPEPSGDLPG